MCANRNRKSKRIELNPTWKVKRPIQNSKTETKLVKANAEADQQQTRTNKSNQKEHANQHQCGRLCSTLHFVFETRSRKKKRKSFCGKTISIVVVRDKTSLREKSIATQTGAGSSNLSVPNGPKSWPPSTSCATLRAAWLKTVKRPRRLGGQSWHHPSCQILCVVQS